MTPEEIRKEVTKCVLDHDYKKGSLLLLAGPGTGKTFSLIKTIEVHANEHLKPNDFYEATLTNAAVEDFLEETRKKFKEYENSTTLHFRAKGILHKYAGRIGRQSDFIVFEGDELDVILADAQVFSNNLNDLKNELRNYQCVSSHGEWPNSEFAKKYTQLQLFYNAVDWYDVVNLAIHILKTNVDIRASVSSEFKFLLIDEYQDLNDGDQKFVQLLLNNRTNLLAVGDDDQSIYSGRYANSSGIVNFVNVYPNAKKIVLPVCSRCPSEVIKATHKLISNNSQRENKPELIPLPETENRALGGFVISVNLKSGRTENEFIGSALEILSANQVSGKQIIVLCLNKEMGNDLFTEMAKNHPNLSLENTMDKKQNDLNEVLIRYLSLFLENPQRNLALRMILEYVFHNTRLEISHLVKYAILKGICLWDALCKLSEVEEIKKTKASLLNFRDVVSEALKKTTTEEKIYYICENYNGLKGLKPIVEAPEETIENTADNTKIKFMTMHSSKGLEADYVFIPFMENDFKLPAKDIEEERRLLYVAMTRAKVGVIFSWAWSRRSDSRFKAGGGPNIDRKPSQFLFECGLNPSMFGRTDRIPTPQERALELLDIHSKHVIKWDKHVEKGVELNKTEESIK